MRARRIAAVTLHAGGRHDSHLRAGDPARQMIEPRYPQCTAWNDSPSLLHGDHDLPKMSAGRMVYVSLLGLRKRKYAIDRWSQPGKADGAIHRVEHLARTDVNAVKVQFLAVDDAGIDSSSSGE